MRRRIHACHMIVVLKKGTTIQVRAAAAGDEGDV
jgi:hypothetical protein